MFIVSNIDCAPRPGADKFSEWMSYWLSRQPVWKNARDVDVSTITFGLEKLPGDSDLDPNSQVSYLPSYDNTYSLWYKGRYIVVTRIEKAEHRWKSTDVLRLQCVQVGEEYRKGLTYSLGSFRATRASCNT